VAGVKMSLSRTRETITPGRPIWGGEEHDDRTEGTGGGRFINSQEDQRKKALFSHLVGKEVNQTAKR